MYIELGVWLACAYALNQFRNRDIKRIRGGLQKIFHDARIEGLRNRNDETFSIGEVYRHDYGYLVTAHIAWGCSAEVLEKLKIIIEDNLECKCEVDKDDFENYVRIKLITNPLNDLVFEPVKTKPYELFLGYEFNGSKVILNNNLNAHLLIGGRNGSGKSRALYVALTNLLYNHSEKEIEVYFSQIVKKELNKFKKCKQVRFFTNDLKETEIMLKKLNEMINIRTARFDEMGIEDIKEWNSRMKKQFMKYIYICMDEFSFYMPSDIDTDEEKELKAKCIQYLKNIVKAGRSCGIFILTVTQRSTVTNIASDLKSQMNRLSFSQKSKIDSLNLIEIDDAVKLKQQECILNSDKYYWLKVPFIDIDIMKKYIPDIITFDDKASEKNIEKINKKQINNDPNLTIIDVSRTKEKEHEEWCRQKNIKITEIDLAKQRKEKQGQLSKEYAKKENTTEPIMNTYNKKKAKVALNEEVATTNVDAER